MHLLTRRTWIGRCLLGWWGRRSKHWHLSWIASRYRSWIWGRQRTEGTGGVEAMDLRPVPVCAAPHQPSHQAQHPEFLLRPLFRQESGQCEHRTCPTAQLLQLSSCCMSKQQDLEDVSSSLSFLALHLLHAASSSTSKQTKSAVAACVTALLVTGQHIHHVLLSGFSSHLSTLLEW